MKKPQKSIIFTCINVVFAGFLDYPGTQVPLDVLAAGQENGTIGLAEWPRYTHEEVMEAIKYLSLDFKKYCQDIDRVT